MIKKRVLSVLLVLAMVLGMIPAVASAETETPEITSAQLVLDSILGINLKVDLKGNPVADYTVEVTIGDAVQKLTGSADGVYTAKLMAHQMTDTIHIALKQGNTVLQEKDWSVKKNYADVIAADPTASDETKALVEAMYHYGQYAAYYKNGGTDPAVSAVETAEAVAEEHKMTLTSTVILGAVAYLYLDESCDLCFKFNEEPMTGKTLWVDGEQVTLTDFGTQEQYKIKDILPQNYGTKHTVQVKDSGNNVVFDLSYSVLSYMYQCQNKTGEDYGSLNKLMAAMRLYGQAAESYQKTLPTYLTEANAGTPALFAATINANPAGHFALAENLDWTGQTAVGIATFSGVLDGQGHSIKGLAMGVGDDGAGNYHTCLFGTNNGTIKNIAFDYSVAAAAGNTMGLIAVNKGTAENLFVKASFAGYSWTTGAIVATNDGAGTVKNCISVVSSTLSDQPAKDRLGSIVGVDYNGKIINCYAVNTENSITTPYVDTWNNGNYTGSAVYANNQLLLSGINTSADPFAGANGWSRFWKMTANGIAFGDKLVIGGAVCVHKDEKPVDGKCDKCGEAVALPAGVVLLNETNAGNPAAFKTLVSANPDYTYYLTEDLDWTGETGAGIFSFDGTLDGQGHSIKGLSLVLIGSGNEWYTSFFGHNNGTVKNLSIEYTVPTREGNAYSLIANNNGTIENLYVKAAFAVNSGHNVASVAHTNTSTGTIKNCIVSMSATAALTEAADAVGPVVCKQDAGGTIQNCHAVNLVNNIKNPYSDSSSSGTYSGNGVYANDQALLDALTAMPAADGWSDCWAITESGITMGGKVVIAGQATQPCTHEDKSPVDGKCDLCGEAVERTDVHLLNMTTVPTIADLVTAINNDLDGDFYLTEDLNYTGSAENTNGIGAFTGTLNGQGHTIKGITIKYNSQNKDNATSFFDSNAGTIENISFEYNINFLNGGPYGLITTNTGVIQNVYAKATLASINTSWYGSAFVGDNSGSAKINNCIVDVAIDGSVINAGDQFGIIVGISRGGTTVQNCYYTYTATEGLTVPTFSNATATWGSTITNVAALDANATVNAADGWADYWSVELKGEEYGIWFGDTLVLAMTKPCAHKDTSYVDGLCDLCGEAVALPEGTYLINSTTAPTKAALVTLINADLDGHFYVTEDLAYSADAAVNITDFTGVLDGQGHTISGIVVKHGNEAEAFPSYLFKSNGGTIQNIGFEYTISAANAINNALIGTNTGTVQNVYAKATVSAMHVYNLNSALVALNSGDKAVIRNCIVDVSLDTSITSIMIPDDPNNNRAFGAVAGKCENSAVVDNCYFKYTANEGITVPGIALPWAGADIAANTAVLDSSVTSLPASAGWSSCWKANAAGIWFSNTQILNTGVELADQTIAVFGTYEASGVSDATIANMGRTEDDRANIFAWYDFQKLYQEITGLAIDVVFVNDAIELDSNKSYFVLGDDLALSAQLDTTGITADNGHKIVKSGDDVYLYGKSGYGTANAVYAFLKQAFGAEFYSDTVYTTTRQAYSIENISDVTFSPSVDYNWAYDGLLYTNNGEAINYAYQMRMGFVNYWQLLGGSYHAFSEIFANGDYSVDVDLNAGGEIGPNSTYVRKVADYIYDLAKNSGKKLIAVGHQDTHEWSASSASKANLNTYGANSGEYLLFMNAVIELLNTDSAYANIPAVEVSMLIYNGSLKAPTSNLDALKVDKNPARGVKLTAMFAPIEMNVNGTPTDSTIKDYYGNTPSYYYGEYAKWQNIFGADNVNFWRYSTIFNDFMVPVNTIKYIKENYQALVGSDNYIKHMMDQGTGKSPVQTNFQALLVYLKGQLGKNANADLDTLITNFCNAYYGAEAGTYIQQLLTAEQEHLTNLSTTMNNTSTGFLGTGKKADISGCHSVPASSGGWFSSTNNLYDAKWWSKNCSDDNGTMLKTWYGYITSALAATTDAEQQARIQVEAIAIRYISLKAHGVALIDGDTLTKVETAAIALGITRYSEGTAIDGLA